MMAVARPQPAPPMAGMGPQPKTKRKLSGMLVSSAMKESTRVGRVWLKPSKCPCTVRVRMEAGAPSMIIHT